MRLSLSCALLASALLGLSACNKAEAPEKVQADVAKAKSDAVEENAKAGSIKLTENQLSRLSAIRPPVGDRYADMAPINR